MNDLQLIGAGKAVLNYDGTRRVNADGKFVISSNGCCGTPNIWFSVSLYQVFYNYWLPPVSNIYAENFGVYHLYINNKRIGMPIFDYSDNNKNTCQLCYLYHISLTGNTFTTRLDYYPGTSTHFVNSGCVFAEKNERWAAYQIFYNDLVWNLEDFDYKYDNVEFYNLLDRAKLIANQRICDITVNGQIQPMPSELAPSL
jgi:hypothetical protein